METIFYLIVAFLFVYEFLHLICNKSIFNAVKKSKERIKVAKLENRKVEIDTIGHTIVVLQFFNLFYLAFVVIGFMSSQWLPFLGLFILSLIPKKWLFISYIDSFLSLFLLAFILVNKYHLHIQFFN